MGHVGLALATSLAAIVHAWLLLRGLGAQALIPDVKGLMWFSARLGIATTLMLTVLWSLRPESSFWFEADVIARALWLALLVIAGSLTYFASGFLLGMRLSDFRTSANLQG